MVVFVQLNKNKMKTVLMYFSKVIIFAFGWKIVGKFPNVPKMIIVLAPHRKGAFEVILGLLVSYACGMNGRHVLVKEEAFENKYIRWFLKKIGAIAIKRNNKSLKDSPTSQVQSIIDEIKNAEFMTLVITPEGTRIKAENPNPKWKTGFYFIADSANIPYLLVAWDYDNKLVIFDEMGPTYTSTDMVNGHIIDMAKLSEWYEVIIPGYVPNIIVDRFSRQVLNTKSV